MGDREAAGGELGEERLDVAQRRLAGRRIADMADRRAPGEGADHAVLVEGVGDMAHRAVAVEAGAVIAGDAGRFLAAMLERVEAQCGHRGGGVGAPDSEHAAFLAELVVVIGAGIERIGGEHGCPRARAGRPYRERVTRLSPRFLHLTLT